MNTAVIRQALLLLILPLASAFVVTPGTSFVGSPECAIKLQAVASSDLMMGSMATSADVHASSAIASATSSSLQVAESVDLAGFLVDTLGGFINSPAILLLPIGVAVALASLIAWFIVSYANPTVESTDFDE
uniref:Uncharacterized protein n=1 Tax=Leptocylindrus danicus TaxID=163516 RepID=A0A7S2PCC7_9STRA|mmetsp:Transcript_29142/g.42788  ORF Transcript_29142/g.42788 Transcript_29142/m.42788 type:complete len:132 (+) Transcript_29142:32-427(+)